MVGWTNQPVGSSSSNQPASSKDQFQVSAPAITLPMGGGAIKGIAAATSPSFIEWLVS